jgi:hypothetical protein
MASFKKHLESNHPEMINDPAVQNFEACCTIISHQENALASSKKEDSNKINLPENESVENKSEEKINKMPQKEEPKKTVLPIVVSEKQETAFPAASISIPISQDIIPIQYPNPYTYAGQNYGIMCIMQSQPQNFSTKNASASFDWMHRLATTPSQNEINLQIPYFEVPPKDNFSEIIDNEKLVNQDSHPCCQPQLNTSLEKRIQELPTDLSAIMSQNDHHHIHCEYCGHCTIMHNGHIDYVHDAELHHYSHPGTI